MILSLYSRRILRAVCLMTPSPSVTCPSAAITTLPLRRTHNTVVERISFLAIGETDYIGAYATAPFGFHAPRIAPMITHPTTGLPAETRIKLSGLASKTYAV